MKVHWKGGWFGIGIILVALMFIPNSYAASKKTKRNKANAEAYCREMEAQGIPCKVSPTSGCGMGWEKAKRFRDGGNAWYACKKNKFGQGSDENKRKAEEKCAEYRRKYGGDCRVDEGLCPQGYRSYAEFKKGGRNYRACIKKEEKKDLYQKQAREKCREYEKLNPGAECKISKNLCPPRWESIGHYRGPGGRNYSACVPKCPEWKVNMEFTIGCNECSNWNSNDCKLIRRWLNNEIKTTEMIYDTPPAMKINPTFVYKANKGGRNLDKLSFKNNTAYRKYMDKNFDHVRECEKRYKSGKNKGKCRKHYMTRGRVRVLITNELKVKGKKIGGKSYFPTLYRRHAPILVKPGGISNIVNTCSNKDRSVLAHELGHVFNLEHTFSRDVCNGDYAKREGSSLKSNGKMNLMDYGLQKSDGCYRVPYLNKCQRNKAALERRLHSYKCRVNYMFIKGLR